MQMVLSVEGVLTTGGEEMVNGAVLVQGGPVIHMFVSMGCNTNFSLRKSPFRLSKKLLLLFFLFLGFAFSITHLKYIIHL